MTWKTVTATSEAWETAPLARHVLDQSPGLHMPDNSRLLSGGLRKPSTRAAVFLDLGLAILRGMIVDNIIYDGFDSVDGVEFSDWLHRHGASKKSLDSPPIRAAYDYVFAFPEGDADSWNYGNDKRSLAAGVALRGGFRMNFDYRHAIHYKMVDSMGATIFAPLFLLLKARGVKFKFFHRVTKLHLSEDKRSVRKIDLLRQAAIDTDIVADADYDPLIDSAPGRKVWPAAPKWGSLVGGADYEAAQFDFESAWPTASPHLPTDVELTKGNDFDHVILGISVGGLRAICDELVQDSSSWHRMLDPAQSLRLRTVQTLNTQYWLDADLNGGAGLGWPHGTTVMTAGNQPLDVWADMTHLEPAENWANWLHNRPKTLIYFTGVLADQPGTDNPYPNSDQSNVAVAARQAVQDATFDWANNHMFKIWKGMSPEENDPAAIRWNFLYHPDAGATAQESRDWQYYRANINPSDRYVLSVPGTTASRLRADGSGYKNLYLAGDWVRTGLNAGCIECAVMAGRQAARAINGGSFAIPGETDFLIGEISQPDNFPFSAQTAPWPWSAAFAVGGAEYDCLTIGLDSDFVQNNFLPPGLLLMPQDLLPAPRHPVCLVFGRAIDVRSNLTPAIPIISSWLGLTYQECIVAVPFVQLADDQEGPPGPFAYLHRKYIDRPLPRLLAHIYSYELRDGEIDRSETRATLRRSKNGAALFSVDFQPSGDYRQATTIPEFGPASEILRLPTIAKTKLPYYDKLVGPWQFSYYDLEFDDAFVLPLAASLTVFGAAGASFPMAGEYALPNLVDGPLGGFRIRTTGTVTNPLSSRSLARIIEKRRGMYAE